MPQKVGIIRERCTTLMRAPKDNRAAIGVQLTKVGPRSLPGQGSRDSPRWSALVLLI